MKKHLVGGLVVVVLVIGVVLVASAWQKQPKNDVFTDTLFEGMENIGPFMIPAAALEGEAAESVVATLKSLRLEPTEETLPSRETNDIIYGRPAGSYQINYQDGTVRVFVVSEALLEIDGKNYYVVDKAGNPVTSVDKTLWLLFHPELAS